MSTKEQFHRYDFHNSEDWQAPLNCQNHNGKFVSVTHAKKKLKTTKKEILEHSSIASYGNALTLKALSEK